MAGTAIYTINKVDLDNMSYFYIYNQNAATLATNNEPEDDLDLFLKKDKAK